MRILITGAAGFIGSEFLNQIVRNSDYEVTVVDSLTYAGRLRNIEEVRNEIDFHRIDIRDRDEIENLFIKSNFYKVIHFAAESHVDNSISNPSIFLETNIFGTQNLLEMSIKYKVSEFLHVSTDEVYGSLNEGFAREENAFNPASAYSASKAAAEHFVNAARHTFNLNTKIVRCSNNYGPRQYPEKLIPFFVGRLIEGKNVPIYGTGENIREWLHVSDCASAIISVLVNDKTNEIYNISSGQFHTNLEVTKMILANFGLGEERIDFIEDRKGHDFRYAINHQKISEDLGWNPQIDFLTGLTETIEWYRDNQWALEKESRA
jgi:dTDP-glucose 4,6-dehydratase